MIKAAGILFREPGGKVLFLEREGWDDGGLWAFPGGKLEDKETPEQAARRETLEEIGTHHEGRMTHLLRNVEGGVDYTTFLMRVSSDFEPDKLVEHTAYKWLTPTDAMKELDLHPGVVLALRRLDMNELDVAKAIAKGDFQSPQFYRNMWLFAIRITGTGLSYRGGLKEYVWRDQGLYLNQEFLERCQGLTVVWVHPESATLNSKEFSDRVIGSVMIPFIKGEEVWGVARIYDADAASDMQTMQISTSPGVSWDDPTVNQMVSFDGGKKLLIEGDPSLLDHIAVVKAGVWDKGGDPTGVQNDLLVSTERADSMPMTPEEQAAADAARRDAEEKARKDADAGQKLDKLLTHLDSISSRLDAFEEREKSREDAARKDAEEKEAKDRADAASRRDAEHEEWKKADAAMCAKDDEDEAKEAKELEEKGEPKEVAADKARKARKDRMDARKDAFEKEEQAKADAARKDATGNTELEGLRRQVAALMAANTITDVDRIAMADEQARVDSVYRSLGKQAPYPMSGETVGAYKVRSHRGIQLHSKKWKGIELHKLPGEALEPILEEIRNDAMAYAREPDDLEAGQLRAIVKVDPSTGQRMTTFVGKGTFFSQMNRQGRRVSKINTKF